VAGNRAITLDGANRVFGVIGITFHHHELGHYYTHWNGQEFAAKTLTEVCQNVLKAIAPSAAVKESAVSSSSEA